MLDYLLFIRDKCRKTAVVDGFEHEHAEGWVTVQGVDEETRIDDASGREEVKSGNRSMSFGEAQKARYPSCKVQWLTRPLSQVGRLQVPQQLTTVHCRGTCGESTADRRRNRNSRHSLVAFWDRGDVGYA